MNLRVESHVPSAVFQRQYNKKVINSPQIV